MIDTIVFKLESGQFKIINKDAFDGMSSKNVGGKYNINTQFIIRYTQSLKKKGIYFPQIQLPERHEKGETMQTLEIQVSLPKLVFGSSIFEIDETHIEAIYNKLQNCLKEIHIEISIEEIKKASIKRIDFCKNIAIPCYFGTAKQVIKILSNFDYKRSSESRHREYANNSNGVEMKFWNNTQGYIFYDKISEIAGNGYTELENKLNATDKARRENNIIRFELSLQRKQSLEALLKRHIKHKKKNFYLEDVLKRDVARTILLEVFNDVFQHNFAYTLTLAEMKENELERLLQDKNMPILEHALISYWVNKVIRIGLHEALKELKHRASPSTYKRQRDKIESILEELNNNALIKGYTGNIVEFFKTEHEKFIIMKPKVIVNHC